MRAGIRHGHLWLSVVLALAAGVATRAKAAVYLPGDGMDTALLQGIANLPTGNDPRSFMAWVNLSSIPPAGEALAGYGSINPFSGYHRSAFDIDPSGQLDMQFQVGYVISTGVSIANGRWDQIVGTYSSSGGVSIYVNGQPVAVVAGVNGFSPTAVDTINIDNNAVTFGYEFSVTNGYTDTNTTGLEFRGDIAADSIWDRVLTPAEVLADYNTRGVLRDTNGLLAEVFRPVPTPEPDSFALLVVGLVGLYTARKVRCGH
jgi:Concanavalin A-like lectin/glucanases superfamily